MKRLIALLLVCLGLAATLPLVAQEQMSPEEQKDWFVKFVEGQLSTPDRQIRISNIDGVLSSTASIREITISDQQGVWLRINNAAIDWDQGALFTGRLLVRSLTADSIEYLRNAIPSGETKLPSPEATPLEVPEFPVAIQLDKLAVPKVTFGESVFGLGSEISLDGSLRLEGGSLTAALQIVRLDGPGGRLDTNIAFRNADQTVDLAVTLTEPPNGIVANLLNIEGRPEVALALKGSGPVNNLVTTMTLDAGGRRALAGTATIAEAPGGLAVYAQLGGPIAELVAPPYRPFFGASTALEASALVRSSGGFEISGFKLSGGQLSLEGSGATTSDGFLNRLLLAGRIADPAGGRVVLPIPGAATSIASADFTIDFGRSGDEGWTAGFNAAGFVNGGLKADTVTLSANGVAANLEDPATRRVTFNADGTVDGIASDDADVQAALGESLGFGAAGIWNAGKPIQIAQLRLVGKALTAGLSGTIDNFVFNGDMAVETSSIAPFSGVAGRELDGALSLKATGTVSPLSGGFDLTLDGTANNLALSEPALDAVLEGEVRLTGRLARTERGLEATGFRLENPNVEITADGTYATGAADFRFSASLADLALVTDEASGALTLEGTARGQGTIALDVAARVARGELAGKTLSNAAFGFQGTVAENGDLAGALEGDAFLEQFRVTLASQIAADAASKRLTGLRFVAGPTRLSGDMAQGSDGLFTGQLELSSTDVSTAAALLLVKATGAANGTISLMPADGRQDAQLALSVANLQAADIALGSADIRAGIGDLFGVPRVNGTIDGRQISAAGIDIATLSARAEYGNGSTAFDATATLANDTRLAASGSLAPLEGGYRLALQQAALTQGSLQARLAQPTAIAVTGDSVSLDAVRFDVGGGSITATGTAGQSLDIALELSALPLSVANAVVPGLGIAGTIEGSGRITGTAADPRASFSLSGEGIDAAALREFGVAPLRFTARGSFADQVVTLQSASATGAGGLTLTASGTAPLNGNGMALTINGSAPLALADRFVADRGGQLSGTLTLDARVTGSMASPRLAGTVSVAGGGYVDPALNLRLVDINGNARLEGNRVAVSSLTANVATGGTISASGTIGLDAPNPVDLALRLNSARYADGNLFVATVSGDLVLRGGLQSSPTLSGNIAVERADITVPDSFGGGAALVEARHIDPPRPVVRTLERATIDSSGARRAQRPPSVVQLDIAVSAPNQIFVRGRGLDAEVGGSVRLTGTVDDVHPVGAFTLTRGRLAILGQRITFDEGSLTLVGDLDPFLDFTARTEGEGITVLVNVTGRASDLEIHFSSSPQLPEDEVLSRLLFNRAMGDLSPLQLAKLAGAAAELAGGSGSLVDSLRAKAGLADLDIVTGEDGSLAVQAGTYIQENIYLGVQAGADGNSRVTVNLDITSDIKAKASTSTNGDTSFGVFYERDY